MRVSTVVPVFNRAHTVARAIDSALRQVCDAAVEVILVDDGSSDDLAAVLKPYGNRVTVIRHARNSGAAAARNTGVAAASGDYVAFLDSDDAWLPGKLARQIEAMRRNKWAASCTAFQLVRPRAPDIVAPRYSEGPLQLADLVWGCFVSPGSTLVFERRVFDEIGPLDTRLGRLEDWDWLLRYAQSSTLGFISEPLARILASSHSDAAAVLSALETLRAKHLPQLERRDRRSFAAALDFERAGALYRAGNRASALPMLLRSCLRSPLGHPALSAVLHNRRAWS
ncbi:MAG TPA: glycosyltransferase family 2 protein [Xanthobacteraceae bacterium]|nr:glycosyltransferase family 2 protein [Xanthobacteraceae bacterium]